MATDCTEQDMQEFGASMAVALANVSSRQCDHVTADLIRKEVRRLLAATRTQARKTRADQIDERIASVTKAMNCHRHAAQVARDLGRGYESVVVREQANYDRCCIEYRHLCAQANALADAEAARVPA